jgi:hypothetical protein
VSCIRQIDTNLIPSINKLIRIKVPLPEQEGPQRGAWQKLEMFGSKELAYAITMHDYELFMAINQVEFSGHLYLFKNLFLLF